jgi:hypothetical protein
MKTVGRRSLNSPYASFSDRRAEIVIVSFTARACHTSGAARGARVLAP